MENYKDRFNSVTNLELVTELGIRKKVAMEKALRNINSALKELDDLGLNIKNALVEEIALKEIAFNEQEGQLMFLQKKNHKK